MKEGFNMYDVLVKNGRIIDGSGDEAYVSDIAIKDNKIIKIAKKINKKAKMVIDARDKNVAPGFIDMHSHDESVIFNTSTVKPKVKQGVTTVVNGNCGLGFIPVNEDNKEELYDFASKLFDTDNLDINWSNYEMYKKILSGKKLGINIVNLIPHGSLRISVMGFKEKTANKDELKEMGDILTRYLEDGVYGMSTGLLYPPCSYADLDELIYLSKILAKYNKIFTIHMRNESDKIINSVKNAVKIAHETGVSVEISHLNISGRANWGKSKEVLDIITQARKEGYNVNCDQYPYKAGSTFISALLPQWALDGGTNTLIKKLKSNENNIKEKIKNDIEKGLEGWDNIIKSTGWDNIIINSIKNDNKKGMVGKSLREISDHLNIDKYELLYKLIVEENGEVTVLIFSVDEKDLYRIFKNEFVMIGSDGLKLDGKPHPRLFGTYFKILDKFIKSQGLVSLEEGVRKMTKLPAEKLNLEQRGEIKENYFADLVIFDYENIKDLSTYEHPQVTGEGIEYVFVNGKLVVEGKELVGKEGGQVL